MPPSRRPTDLSGLALTRGSSHHHPPPIQTNSGIQNPCGTSDQGAVMSEEAQRARQALQESSDLREQGHTDD